MSEAYSTETILLAVVPKFTAALSIVCSFGIVQRVIRSPKESRNLYHRIMLGISVSDIMASTIYFLGTWLIPSGTKGQYGPVFGAVGNTGTCTFSGFFTQFAICSPLYNGTLCLYYLLVIRFKWPEKRLVKIEPLIHGIPISFAFGTALSGVMLHLYGSVEWLCWVNPDPPQTYTWLYRWAFLFIPLWTCVVLVSVVMGILWWTTRKTEQAIDRYRFGGEVNRERSRKVAAQGMMYIAAFYVTWFFPSLQRIIELAANKNYFVLQFFDTALLPLQGFLNCLIYIKPRFEQERRRDPNLNFLKAIWITLQPLPNHRPSSQVRQSTLASRNFGSLFIRPSQSIRQSLAVQDTSVKEAKTTANVDSVVGGPSTVDMAEADDADSSSVDSVEAGTVAMTTANAESVAGLALADDMDSPSVDSADGDPSVVAGATMDVESAAEAASVRIWTPQQ